MTLMEATAPLLAAMVELDQQVAPYPWTESLFYQEKEAGSLMLVGVNGEECVVAYGIIRPMVEEWHLMTVGVSPSCRRQGWGRQLTCALLAGAARQGGERVILEVAATNGAACHLYRGVGFREIGRRKGYYQLGNQREDALVMVCSLPLTDKGVPPCPKIL